MLDSAFFGNGNQLSRHDLYHFKREEGEDRATVPEYSGKVFIKKLSQLVGRFASTEVVVLPAPVQYRAMQGQQIIELRTTGDYN